ncbi:MAG: Ig-like domain-containing protein [Saprospiraceae bacterium]
MDKAGGCRTTGNLSTPSKKPDISLKGKTVTVTFDEEEVLRENATYTINFGKSIRDLSAGNEASDLRFVFSTGPVIDSLQITGSVIDAFTLQPVENALVMLYENLADSVVRKEKPFYFARTDKAGNYKIENVRADTFKVFSLVDANLNYIFDQPNELIGFLDEAVEVNDTTINRFNLKLFEPQGKLRVKATELNNFANGSVTLSHAPDSLEWIFSSALSNSLSYLKKDSLVFWYDMDTVRQWNIYLRQDTSFYDTLKVKPGSKGDYLKEHPLTVLGSSSKKSKGKMRSKDEEEPVSVMQIIPAVAQNPLKPFKIQMVHPITAIDTSLFILTKDTLEEKLSFTLSIDTVDKQTVYLEGKWEESSSYNLLVLPQAMTDFFGQQNDSLQFSFNVKERKDFGNLILKFSQLDSSKQYLVYLIDKSGTAVEEYLTSEKTDYKAELKALNIGPYIVRMVEDKNFNGRWDPGDYDLKIQPEPIHLQTIEQLRANWDLEVEIPGTVFDKEAGISEKKDLEKE